MKQTRMKRRVKIKVRNLLLLLFIMIVTLVVTVKISFAVANLLTSKNNTTQPVEKKEKTKQKTEENTNIESLSYYKEENKKRYEAYRKIHNSYETEQIVKNVNMNLDLIPYEDSIEATRLNELDILVNKYYHLDKNYVPNNLEALSRRYAIEDMKLVKVAKDAFEKLAKDAEKENLKIVALSTYRSYKYQVNLYNRYARQDGTEKADSYSGRPGYSEHQTGLAVDVYNYKKDYTEFGSTKEFVWMQNNAYKYGFILRYPKGKEEETGYQYEEWHYRYVGEEIAKYIQEHKISYEEYYATKIKD